MSIEMSSPQVLGSVDEGAGTCHIVYRQKGKVNGSEISIVDIMTLQQIDGHWSVSVPEEFEAFVASVQERLTRPSK